MNHQPARLIAWIVIATCVALIGSFRPSATYAAVPLPSTTCMQIAELTTCDSRIPIAILPGLSSILAEPTSAGEAALQLNRTGYLHLVLSLEGVDRDWAERTETLIRSMLREKSLLAPDKSGSEAPAQAAPGVLQTANITCGRTLCEVQYRATDFADINALYNALRTMARNPILESLLVSKHVSNRSAEEKTFGGMTGGVTVPAPSSSDRIGVVFLVRDLEASAKPVSCLRFWSLNTCSISKPLLVAPGFESFLATPTSATSAGVSTSRLLHMVTASETRDDSWAQPAEGTLRTLLLEQLRLEEGADEKPVVTFDALECRFTLCEIQVTANSNRTLNRWIQQVDRVPGSPSASTRKLFAFPVLKEFVYTAGPGFGTRAVVYFQRG